MKRAHVEHRLSEYLDGEVSGHDAEEVEAHLSVCQVCADELAYLRRIKALLGSRPANPSPGLWSGVAERIAGQGPVEPWGQFEWVGKRLMPVLAAAAVLAVAFLGSLNGSGSAVTLEEYLKTTWGPEASETLLLSDAEISHEDVLQLAASVNPGSPR